MQFRRILFAATLFVSAFLLFSVQPIVGRYLLPKLGGGTSVWTTAMLFFQILLLAGYGCAHLLTRLKSVPLQLGAYFSLMLTVLALPLLQVPQELPDVTRPVTWQLLAMASMIAGPFFVLSMSAPLFQYWFYRTAQQPDQSPYFLYAASNLGSMVALLSYPVLVEPLLGLDQQSSAWIGMYTALLLIVACHGWAVRKAGAIRPLPRVEDTESAQDAPGWLLRLRWVFLAFVPSSLLLGATTYITSEIITVPLFWVVPLALYLLSFIIAFSEKPLPALRLTRILQPLSALALLFLIMAGPYVSMWNQSIFHLTFFFFSALLCHQEMAALKPSPRYLTEFFLIVSIGGALGGVFNSLLAPLIFGVPHEYMIALMLAVACRYMGRTAAAEEPVPRWAYLVAGAVAALTILVTLTPDIRIDIIAALLIVGLSLTLIQRRWIFLSLYLFAAVLNPLNDWNELKQAVVSARNYFGIITVFDDSGFRYMRHGISNHGGQRLDPERRFESFAYFGPSSGLADVYDTPYMKDPAHGKVAILGLGTGSVACFYNAPGRSFDYFEIDPDVVRIAKNPQYFTFLNDCNVKYNVFLGDGRLLLQDQPSGTYDLIHVDVFSSDNIPIHLITADAFKMYLNKLSPNGVMLFHISNRYFSLQTELAAIAQSLGKVAYHKSYRTSSNPSAIELDAAEVSNDYLVITDNVDVINDLIELRSGWKKIEAPSNMRPWTDEYSNLLRAVKL